MKIRPEIKKPVYWLHILLIALIVIYTKTIIFGFLNFLPVGLIRNIIGYGLAIALADIIVHTILNLN